MSILSLLLPTQTILKIARILPAVLLAVPLITVSFQRDEMRNIYRDTDRFGTIDPFGIAAHVYDGIAHLIRIGNFRPVGRFLDHLQRVSLFEIAGNTGLAPHVVLGLVRLTMLTALTLVAIKFIAKIVVRGGLVWDTRVVMALAPAVIAGFLVAGGPDSPIIYFPFLFLVSAIVVLGVPQLVARERDFEARRLQVREWMAMLVLGAVIAMILEVVYVALPLTAAFILAHTIKRGISLKSLIKMAVTRRLAAVSVGFLVVFIPVRWMIEGHCGQRECYIGSDMVPQGFTLDVFGARILTGIPVAAWHHNAELMRSANLSISWGDMFNNKVLILLALTIFAATVYSVWHLVTPKDTRSAVPSIDESLRTAAALSLCGVCLIILPSLMISLSRLVQRDKWEIGFAWRDTVLVSLGWAIVAVGIIVLLVGHLANQQYQLRRAGTVLLLTIVCVGLLGTLLSHVRLGRTNRADPLAIVTNAIAVSTIDFDKSHNGNNRRCELIDTYTEIGPDPQRYNSGVKLRVDLNSLMIDRHGQPFCEESQAAS